MPKFFSLLPVLIVIAFILTSCDPVRYMLIENKNSIESELVINFNEIEKEQIQLLTAERDSIVIVKYYGSQIETIVFDETKENSIKINFPNEVNSNSIKLLFGWGRWSDQSISDFSKLIQSIDVNQDGNSQSIMNHDEIFLFFKNHKQGRRIVVHL